MNRESIQIRSDFNALNAAQRNGETVFSEPRVVDAEFPSEYLQYAGRRFARSVSCLCLELYLELSYFLNQIYIIVTVTEVTKVPKFQISK